MRIWPILALALIPGAALAQPTTPFGTTDYSGTVATAGTYQVIQPLNVYRHGCTIQNTSANPESIRVSNTVYTLAAGATFVCAVGNMVIDDTISITSATAGSTYSAGFQ